MYIKYTFLSGNNLAGLLVFKVLEAVALPVTIPLAVEALDSGLCFGCPRRTIKTLAILLWLLALRTLAEILFLPGNGARKCLDVSKDQLGNPKRKV
jgi:hypothetical protein